MYICNPVCQKHKRRIYMRIHFQYIHRCLLPAVLLVVSVITTYAAPKRLSSRHITDSERTVIAYKDSITGFKQKIDSLMAANDSLRAASAFAPDGRYFRLFAPLNFYHGVSRSRLGLGANNNDTLVNNTLMNVYLTAPYLVRYTDSELQERAKEQKTDDIKVKPRFMEMKEQVKKNETINNEIDELRKEPIEIYVAKPNFWKFYGDYYLQFMQNHVSQNWYKGGSDNYSLLGTVTLQYNYNNKQKVKWDNKLEMRLGIQNSESDTINKFKVTDDLIRYTSSIGLQAHKNWYYTAQVIASTQFAQGRKDNKTKVFSDFMSPFNLNVSLGMDYTVKTKADRLKGKIHLAPIAYNLKYVDRLDLSKSFGLEKDRHTLHDYGSQLTVELDWKPSDMFKWHTRLYAYTTYEKFEMEWENTLTFLFNRFISANLYLYPRFDDSAKRVEDCSFWQFKEYLSFGFSYSM